MNFLELVRYLQRFYPLKKIWRTWHSCRQGIHNLRVFGKAVWNFCSYDYTGMLKLMELAAGEMEQCQRLGHHSKSEKYAQQLLVVRCLCHRLIDEEHFENAGVGGKDWRQKTEWERQQLARHASNMAKWDAEYLGRLLRFVQHWWD